jgi:DNA-binding HxlR family transcriptional regulator
VGFTFPMRAELNDRQDVMSSGDDTRRSRDADRRQAEGTLPEHGTERAIAPPERIASMRTKSALRVDDPITRTMEALGERWTFQILRQAFFGVRRFNQMQRHLGVSRNILAARLRMLVELGVLERRRYRRDPDFYEYRLTERGLALYPPILAFTSWGDRFLPRDETRPALILRHKPCGQLADPLMVCSCCGKPMHARDVEVQVDDEAEPSDEAERSTAKLRPRSTGT